MTEICSVHRDTVRLIEKQTERTDTMFVEVRGLAEDVAIVETKIAEIRSDTDSLAGRVEIIDYRMRDLENFKAATTTSLQSITTDLHNAAIASKEFSSTIVDLDRRISIMTVKVAGIISILSAVATYLANKFL